MVSPTSMKKRAEPQYEWMGPPGALFIMLSLPLTIYFLYFACTPSSCLSLSPSSPDFLRLTNPLTAYGGWRGLLSSLFSVRATVVYVGWLLLHFVLYLVVPGKVVQGAPFDEHGRRLDYPLNGLQAHNARLEHSRRHQPSHSRATVSGAQASPRPSSA